MDKSKIMILALIIVIPLIILILYFNLRGNVTTTKSNGNSSLPQINIKGKDTKNINKVLEDIYNKYMKDEKSVFNYSYENYNDITSILIKIEEYEKDTDEYITKYLSYNVDENGDYLTTENLIEKLGYEFDSVEKQVENKLKEYYSDIISYGYLSSDCDFNCFLNKKHNIKYILENTVFVIQNKQLIAYINLYTNNASGDRKYFDQLENPYKLIINR